LEHPGCGLPVTAYRPQPRQCIKKTDFENTKRCDLRFDLRQTLESAVDQYTGKPKINLTST